MSGTRRDAPAGLRRLLVAQAAVMLLGWFAFLACQAAVGRQETAHAAGPTAAATSGAPRNASPAAFVEGAGTVCAFIAFAWAGSLRARLHRALPAAIDADRDAARRAAEAA